MKVLTIIIKTTLIRTVNDRALEQLHGIKELPVGMNELVDTGSFTLQFSVRHRPYGERKQTSALLNFVRRIFRIRIKLFWCKEETGWLAYIHRRNRIFYLWKRIRDFLEGWRNSQDILSYTLITDRLSPATAFLDQHNLCVICFVLIMSNEELVATNQMSSQFGDIESVQNSTKSTCSFQKKTALFTKWKQKDFLPEKQIVRCRWKPAIFKQSQ